MKITTLYLRPYLVDLLAEKLPAEEVDAVMPHLDLIMHDTLAEYHAFDGPDSENVFTTNHPRHPMLRKETTRDFHRALVKHTSLTEETAQSLLNWLAAALKETRRMTWNQVIMNRLSTRQEAKQAVDKVMATKHPPYQLPAGIDLDRLFRFTSSMDNGEEIDTIRIRDHDYFHDCIDEYGGMAVSIAKWQYLHDKQATEPTLPIRNGGANTCALCIQHIDRSCADCPINLITGRSCATTPYELVFQPRPPNVARGNYHLQIAKQELAFLHAVAHIDQASEEAPTSPDVAYITFRANDRDLDQLLTQIFPRAANHRITDVHADQSHEPTDGRFIVRAVWNGLMLANIERNLQDHPEVISYQLL